MNTRDKKHTGLYKFEQRIPPRWYKLSRGGFWHIGALSCHNSILAVRHRWRVARLRGVSYISIHAEEEVAGDNDEGVCEHKDSQAPQQVQAQLWRDVGV